MNPKLKRKMGKELASLFEGVGKASFETIRARIADTTASEIAIVADDLAKKIRDEHGKNGLNRAVSFIPIWAEQFASEILENSSETIGDKVLAALKHHFPTEEENPEQQGQEQKTSHLIKVKGNFYFREECLCSQ